MPTDALAAPAAAAPARHPLAARRILRLALGTALCLCFSQMVNWPLSFVAPVLTSLILGLPLPQLGLKKNIGFMIAMFLPMIVGMSLLPFLVHARWAGILLVGLGLFYSFYYTAKGGSPIMGTFMTIGLTLVVTIGSVSPQFMVVLVQSMMVCAVVGLAFAWLAHALLPDPPPDPALPKMKPPPPPVHTPEEAVRLSIRSMFVVFPLALVFMFSSASTSYTVVMIKSASLGQQATSDESREMGRSLLESTFWGGIGAIIGWYALSLWPSLVFYTLLVLLAGLLFGRGIFKGPAVGPKFSMWSYAFLTMLIILTPAVLDSPVGSSAEAAFWSRLGLIAVVAVWGTITVAIFDAFWKKREAGSQENNLMQGGVES